MSAPPRPPRDHAVRERAASDFTTNLVVSAGAGTGKTTLLVERVLTAIGAGWAPLPAIAAITFTDKAAGELRHRLASGLGELGELARGIAPHGESSAAKSAFTRLIDTLGEKRPAIDARAADAAAMLDRATVTTIHGFCAELLRAHPLASGLPPGFAADRGVLSRRLAQEEWTPFIEEELGRNGRRGPLWGRVLDRFTMTEVEAIARSLACGAIPDAALRQELPAFDLATAVGGDALHLADAIHAAIERTAGLTVAPRGWLAEAERALRALAGEGTVAARRVIEASARIGGAMPSVRTKKVSLHEAEAIEALEERARPLLQGLALLDERADADLLEALLPFARRLRQRQLRTGLVDFDALLVRSRDLLRDVLPVRDSLKRRFGMILVDEFQDTDPIQYEIVFYLAERDGDHASDAYATRLAPGRLFIVGDAKQSIYRFRGADYTAYRNAVGHVVSQGGAELALTSNFRSTPGVLGPLNALFAGPSSTVWRASPYQPRYEPIEAERESGAAPAVEVWTASVAPDALAAERRRAEGLALAAEITAIAGAGRALRYDDVLVLFRGFSELAPYLRALREAEVPFVVSGGRRFFERTEIVQAMAVLRAVADPLDQVALLAYLRSPAGGVPDTELAARAAGGEAICPTLDAAEARLAALRADAARLPVDAAVRHVLAASGLVALSGLAFEAAQRVANLEKLALAASDASRDGRRALLATIDAIEDGLDTEEEGDSPLADAELDAVRVMSIHRAKGLEARVVILADTAGGRSSRGESRFTARMTRSASGEFVRLSGPAFQNGVAIASSLDASRHEAAEDVRLLYVALTRARDRLIVFRGGSRRTRWVDALSAWGGEVAHRVVAATRPRARPPAPPPEGAPGAVARYEAAAAIVSAAASPFRSPSRFDDAGGAAFETIDGALPPSIARAVGRWVHARLAGLGVTAPADALREAEAMLRAFDESPLAARLAALDVVGREVPVLLREGDAHWRGVIDLIYRDDDGAIVVADFKTDAADDGAVLRHRGQLGVYVRAVRRAMPEARVRAELWMLRSGRVLEVEGT